MTYCVGTYPGGCDVIKDESLGGTSTTVVRVSCTKLATNAS